MIKENGFATRKGFVKNRGLETATTQVHRERKERNQKRHSRQYKRMQLLMRRRNIEVEKDRQAYELEMKSASVFKRIRWWFIKLWRKLTLTG